MIQWIIRISCDPDRGAALGTDTVSETASGTHSAPRDPDEYVPVQRLGNSILQLPISQLLADRTAHVAGGHTSSIGLNRFAVLEALRECISPPSPRPSDGAVPRAGRVGLDSRVVPGRIQTPCGVQYGRRRGPPSPVGTPTGGDSALRNT